MGLATAVAAGWVSAQAVGTTRPAAPASAPANEPDSRPATSGAAQSPSTQGTPTTQDQSASIAPAGTQPSATQPAATQPAATIRLDFKDAPIDTVLEQLSQAAGFVVIKEAPLQARVTVMSMRPVTPAEAVTILDAVLRTNGFTAVHDGRNLRIVQRDKARKGDVPVRFGDDPDQLDGTDQLVTQVIPLKNIDAVKLAQDLKPLVAPDTDLTSNAGGNAIILTDSSANVRRVVRIVASLDHREGTASTIRIIHLKNASAESAAHLVLSIFRPPDAHRPPQPGQPATPPAGQPDSKRGSGVDQALYGGKVTAAADERTNTVVVAGPEDTVKLIESMLQDLDANPATAVTIKSFHLKIADAQAVARMIPFLFENGAQPGQARGVGEQAASAVMHAKVTAFPEERTNVVVVAAPSTVMAVVEDIIKDLETAPNLLSTIQTFHLKYADVTTAAITLTTVFHDQPGAGHKHPGNANPDPIAITSDARTNTLIVSATADAMRQAEKLIAELDANPADSANVRFFHLKQADAAVAAKLINGLFEPPKNQQIQPPPAHHVAVNAQADWRSNTVIVSAPPESMKVAEDLIHEIETNPLQTYDIKSYALTTADATATSKLITSIFSPDAAQAAAAGETGGAGQPLRTKVIAAPDDRTNTLVVTAPPDSLRVIDVLVKMLDSNAGRGSDMQVFPLQYADAGSAAKLIESIFPPPPGAGRPGAAAAAAGAAEVGPKVIAASDDRTNTLVITAPPDVLRVIDPLVRQLDSNPASQQTFFIYRIRNGQAANMASVLNQMFTGGTSPTTPGAAPAGTSSLASFASQRTPLSSFGSSNASRGSAGGLGSSSNSAVRRTTSSLTPTAGGAGAAGVPPIATELTGQAYFVPDPDSNSLLVTTASKYETQVRQILAELDHPVPQVLIKVLVAEVTHDNNADIGTDFSILNTRASGLGQTFASSFGKPGTGLVVSFLEEKLNATLHALAQQNKLDVLSRPYILTSDNQPAEILVGQQVPLVTSNYTTDLGQVISNYQYQKIGIIVDVTPHINPDGLVTLDVAPEISALSSQTVNVGPNINAPVIDDRSASSRVAIHDGQTIVIGGLMQDQKNKTVNKIPILGDLPLVGFAFSREQVDVSKTELLIFLTPHVAPRSDSLAPMSEQEMKGMELVPRSVRPGAFQSHLQGLQRGTAPQTQPIATTQPLIPVIEINPGRDETPLVPTTRPVHLPTR